jgi:predicted nucleic acid-binding protein
MLESKRLVINTGPIIALVAALGDLTVLRALYDQVIVPFEVCGEILAGGASGFAVAQFEEATWLQRWPQPVEIAPYLLNLLDRGEASVLQLALNENVKTVCIDESAGRRNARIHNLLLTGSIGILVRAKKEGFLPSMREALEEMESRGIWLGKRVIQFALHESGEGHS